MDGFEMKQWRCKNGHVLGVVQRAKLTAGEDTRHVSRLMLYRQAIDPKSPAEVDVIAVMEGTALDIRCSVCGEVRPWYIGADALERLMAVVSGLPSAKRTGADRMRGEG